MRRLRPLLLCAVLLAGAVPATGAAAAAPPSAQADAPRPLDRIVPAPASATPLGEPYTLTEDAAIHVREDAAAQGARGAAEHLAGILRPSTSYQMPVKAAGDDTDDDTGGIVLAYGGPRSLGEEGYRLRITEDRVLLRARSEAGFFYGVQTLRQLLPARVESGSVQDGPWQVAGGTVTDMPRFEHRGAMLDVSRHFFTVDEVKRYIDQLAMYKFNRLHLHLSDDQGWRIAIDSWPRLATYGGSTEVGGGPGGYYTKAEYREILSYAADHELLVVPEIDMPGHTNAALASYAELNCDGEAPPLYTGIQVGFSSLCVPLERTYDFVDDVVGEIAAMTPGPYLHIGGDEAHSTSHEDYVAFMERAQRIVAEHGKTVVGWHQLAGADLADDAVVQYWGVTGQEENVAEAARNGNRVVLSPANRLYLDMKYNEDTRLGLSWAGYVEVKQSYDWNPGAYLQGVPESAILGVEAPMWSETLETNDDIEFMAFPRLPGAAELGWSPAATHDWEDYRGRLAEQAPRWEALGIDYWRSPQVPWDAATSG